MDMAIGFVKGAPVDKGPFVNAILAMNGEGHDAAAYLAVDGDGKIVSLNVRVNLSEMTDTMAVDFRNAGIPVRDGQRKLWLWGSGETQPVGRKGSRWTVGGPRISTVSRDRKVKADRTGDVKLTAAQKRTRTMLANMSDAERKAVLS